MTAGGQRLYHTDSNGDEQAANEQVCWSHENQSRLTQASKVNPGDDEQNSETQRKRFWLKARYDGYKSAHSGGNAHSHD